MKNIKLLKLNTKTFKSPTSTITRSKQILHDIMSPIQTLKILESGNIDTCEDDEEIKKSCIKRIHEITKDVQGENELTCIPNLIILLKKQKQIELNRDISTVIKLQYPWIKLQINKQNLSRILSNLINNADAASTADQSITLSVTDTKGGIKFSITDKGRGISKSNLLSIGNFGISKSPNGSGLGLASAVKQVNDVNGQISCRTIPSFGTNISLFLPH